jgi:desulfoferrodoxin (superoxide reductase-like protein)
MKFVELLKSAEVKSKEKHVPIIEIEQETWKRRRGYCVSGCG